MSNQPELIQVIKISELASIRQSSTSSKIYLFIFVLILLTTLVLTEIVTGKFYLYLSFLVVVATCLKFSDRDLIRLTIMLFVLNGIMRRFAAKDSGYFTSNDVMILLPYIPIVFLLVKNFKVLKFDNRLLLLIFLIFLLSIPNFQRAPANIGWGLLNLSLVSALGQVSRRSIDEAFLTFVIRLGLVCSGYIFYQKLSLPFYDLGWCLSRRSQLVILESCVGDSTRLWGTMESAVNMACFLAVCLFLALFRSKERLSAKHRALQLAVIFVAILLTGTRTFIFLIPLVYFFTAYRFKKLSIPKLAFGIPLISFIMILLPNLGLLLKFEGFWVNRLDITSISGDRSLQDRLTLVANFNEQVSLKNLFFGDGIGSKSRGLNAIDNGFLSLVLEIGLPLTILLLVLIFNRMRNTQILANSSVVQCWSVCCLLVFANFSYVVFTGSSSIFFWLLFFAIEPEPEGSTYK